MPATNEKNKQIKAVADGRIYSGGAYGNTYLDFKKGEVIDAEIIKHFGARLVAAEIVDAKDLPAKPAQAKNTKGADK